MKIDNLSKNELVTNTELAFKSQFNSLPNLTICAPGRINIIGEHTDYNGGYAMPVAIDKYICVAISLNKRNSSYLYSINFDSIIKISNNDISNERTWIKLATCSIKTFIQTYSINKQINIAIGGNLPIGCGLSSSTAFVVSIIYSLKKIFSINFCNAELVEFCKKIENVALENTSGSLDHNAIIRSDYNKIMLIDFFTNSVEYMNVKLFDANWVIINSNIQRELSKSEYIVRVNECKYGLDRIKEVYNINNFRDIDFQMLSVIKNDYPDIFSRLSHLLNENNRVLEMKNYLLNSDYINIGKILLDSHISLRDLYKVSCAEIDYIIAISEKFQGWYGGRIIGGGFGGCSLHLIDKDHQDKYLMYIADNYYNKFNKMPNSFQVQFKGGVTQINKS